MLKSFFIKAIITAVICFLFQANINAQYLEDKHYTGASIGLSFLGSAFQIGGNYEYALLIENFGKIGVGGVLRYWGYSDTFPGGKWSYTNILTGIQGNYHFDFLEDKQLDPYAGLVLAYDGGSVSYSGPGNNYKTPSHGGFWLGFQGGLRYWISPDLAAAARVSFGTLSYGALELGVDFKF